MTQIPHNKFFFAPLFDEFLHSRVFQIESIRKILHIFCAKIKKRGDLALNQL